MVKSEKLTYQIEEEELNQLKDNLKDKADEFAKRVAPVYKMTGWNWASFGIPSREDIKRETVRLIDNLKAGHQYYYTTTGGIKVVYRFLEETDHEVHWEGELSFCLSEYADASSKLTKSQK